MSTVEKRAGDGRVDTVVVVDDGVYDPYVGSSSASLVCFSSASFALLGSLLLESNPLECCCLWRDSREQEREREREQKIAKETVSFAMQFYGQSTKRE